MKEQTLMMFGWSSLRRIAISLRQRFASSGLWLKKQCLRPKQQSNFTREVQTNVKDVDYALDDDSLGTVGRLWRNKASSAHLAVRALAQKLYNLVLAGDVPLN